MSWNCSRCSAELGDYNGCCEYCKVNDNVIVYNPDKYYVRDICIYHIEQGVLTMNKGLTGEELINSIESNQSMTPQEKLHAILFYHETVLVKDMDRLTLRAHIEELSKIAFEARARYGAAKNEDDLRDKEEKRSNKPEGFSRSVHTDEATTDAINTIKERQKKLTKQEKIQAGLEKLGISSTDAAKLMSAGTILGRLKNRGLTAPEAEAENKPTQPLFNPFKKEE